MIKSRHVLFAVLAVLGVVCAIGLWRVAMAMPLAIPLDPNEGWNAYHAAAAMAGHALYPAKTAYLVNNYPPLSFTVVGVVGLLTGDFIVAGRMVSLAAFAAVAVLLALIARSQGVSRTVALLPPLWFAAMLLLSSDYVGMDDPQMLAHAVSLAGLAVLLRRPDWRFAVPAAAALFVTAVFIKHNVIALPIAATAWLLWEKRRQALNGLVFYGCLFGLIGLILFRLVYGLSLFDVVATARQYSAEALVAAFKGWLYWAGFPGIALYVLLWRFGRDAAVRFVALYAFIATAIGLYFLGGAGVDVNVLFEADIALALAMALAVQRLSGWRAPVLAAVLAAPLIGFAAGNEEWRDANLDPSVLHDEAVTAKADIAFMRAQPGPGLCEMLSFCYWAGKPPQVDMFNIGQAFDTGSRSDAEIVQAVKAKRYGVIQFDPGAPYALGENVYQALTASYRLHHRDDYGSFYVPN